MVHDDERSLRVIAEAEEILAKSAHGAGVVFITVMCGVQGVEDDDLSLDISSDAEEVIEPLVSIEQIS